MSNLSGEGTSAHQIWGQVETLSSSKDSSSERKKDGSNTDNSSEARRGNQDSSQRGPRPHVLRKAKSRRRDRVHSDIDFLPSSDGSRDGREKDGREKDGESPSRKVTVTVGKASWSVGAEFHSVGGCKPCAWNWKPGGCIKGTGCTFCHMCSYGTLKTRRKERVAELRAERLGAEREAEEAQQRREIGSPLAAGQEYMVAASASSLDGSRAYEGAVPMPRVHHRFSL